MSNAVTVFQLKSPVETTATFNQTPIYIGTAASSITVSCKPGVFSLAIPQNPTGTTYIERSLETSLRYWKNIGEYSLVSQSTDGLSITLNALNSNYNPSVSDLANCTIFVLENNVLTQTSYVLNCKMAFNGDSLILKDVRLTQKLTPINPNATILLGQLTTITNPNFVESAGTANILSLPDQLMIPGLNIIVNGSYTFHYKVTDFRTATINYEDAIPEEYTNIKYSSLATLVKRHRQTTTKPMTVCAVTNENVDDLLTVLANIELKPNDYGYALVPAFYNYDVGSALKSFVTSLENSETAFLITYIWEPLIEEVVLVSADSISQV